MVPKVYGISWKVQEAEIRRYCEGSCNQIYFGGLIDGVHGELAVCKEERCPHEESVTELGTCMDGAVYLRTLTPVR